MALEALAGNFDVIHARMSYCDAEIKFKVLKSNVFDASRRIEKYTLSTLRKALSDTGGDYRTAYSEMHGSWCTSLLASCG